jgi:hypothetical protein
MSMDLINGLFEFVGALLLLLNVRRLAQDKKISGVHWGPTVFFTAWGVWNLFYYPSLDQRWSFLGGVCLVAVNLIWLLQLCYFAVLAEWDESRRYWAECITREETRAANESATRNWHDFYG